MKGVFHSEVDIKTVINKENNMNEQVIQLYSQKLAQANHDIIELTAEVQRQRKELSEFHRVLNSDETLKALFDEQRGKL